MATNELVKVSDKHYIVSNARLNKTGRVLHAVCPNCGLGMPCTEDRQKRTCRVCRAVYKSVRDLEARKVEFFVLSIPTKGLIGGNQPAPPPSAAQVSANEIREMIADEIDGMRDTLLDTAKKAAADLAPIDRYIVAPMPIKSVKPGTKKKLSGVRHKGYEEAMACIRAIGKVFMVGPTGSGKSFLFEQMAKDCGARFGMLSCSEGLNEAHMTGRMLFNGNFIGTPLVDIVENGGFFLFDEVDAGDANTLLSINALTNTSNGVLVLPNRPKNPLVKKHPNCFIGCAANTWGAGSDMEYVGRNQLDKAFLERFVGAKMFLEYDRDLETSIAAKFNISYLSSSIWAIRENVMRNKVRQPVSMRWFENLGAISRELPDLSGRELIDRCMIDWTSTEKAKALDSVQFEDDPIDVPSSADRDSGEPSTSNGNSDPKCDVCGKPMMKRTAQKGKFSGQKFWGCSGFPSCRNIQKVA